MKMFKPNIGLTLNPSLKTYAMDAVVTTPNGCYFSGGAARGLPEGVVVTPEVEPVTLTLFKRDGICTQALNPIQYHLPGLPVTIGKTSLAAFTVLEGTVLGTASAPIPGTTDAALAEALAGEAAEKFGAVLQSVSAWIDAMPIGDPTLHAVMCIWAPCANYEYKIEDVGPFGFTGKTNLLRLTAKRPEICLTATKTTELTFSKTLSDVNEFDSVAVAFEGEIMLDPAEIVH